MNHLSFSKKYLSLLAVCFLLAVTRTMAYDVTVAKDGTGNFITVQAAINAAPSNLTAAYTIFIKNGKYREKITIPSNKPFLQLIGESVANTILSWDDYSGKPIPGGGTYGTSTSATVTINAPDCAALNITFENTTGDAPQALAISVNADRCAFRSCRFLGGQDTILTNGAGNRQYFRNCYIDGVVDFIFGNAVAVFDSCNIYPRTRLDNGSGGYVTAANTPAGQTYGYVFRNCSIFNNRGTTSYTLGRPWQNDGVTTPASNTKVVFLNTRMSSSISPAGWSVWTAQTVTSLIYYAEYQSRRFDGALADTTQRVAWSHQLTAAQAATYTNSNIFGTWDPCAVMASFCTYTPAAIAVSNFRGVKGATVSTLTWNISWPMTGIIYEVYRSATKYSGYSLINTITAANDTNSNFGMTDPLPAAGSALYYYVKAYKAGFATHITDTIVISRKPTITVAGTLNPFTQGAGAPSAAQAYGLYGDNLTAPVTITPPANYEISADTGATWHGAASPIVLTPVNNVIAVVNIQVRLNAPAPGIDSGFIVHTTPGGDTVLVKMTGTVLSTPLPVSVLLIDWPFTTNNSDTAALRPAGVLASSTALSNLTLSNGTTVATVPAYSAAHGQAFSPSTAGDGLWTTAVGGNGGTLNRSYYEQFTITAAQDYSVRIDSLMANADFYGTTSNTKLAVVYSLSNFTADSADVTGGTGFGSPLVSTANGAFATPVLLPNQTTGTQDHFSFTLANGGVTLAAGKTLTVRMYFSCGSTSAGRYGKLKDVYAKGFAKSTLGIPAAPGATEGLTLYPNPSAHAVTINHGKMQGGSVEVWSADGRKIRTMEISAGKSQTVIDISGWTPGNYLVVVTDGVIKRTARFTRL